MENSKINSQINCLIAVIAFIKGGHRVLKEPSSERISYIEIKKFKPLTAIARLRKRAIDSKFENLNQWEK